MNHRIWIERGLYSAMLEVCFLRLIQGKFIMNNHLWIGCGRKQVVAGFCKKKLMLTNEARFYLNGFVNRKIHMSLNKNQFVHKNVLFGVHFGVEVSSADTFLITKLTSLLLSMVFSIERCWTSFNPMKPRMCSWKICGFNRMEPHITHFTSNQMYRSCYLWEEWNLWAIDVL